MIPASDMHDIKPNEIKMISPSDIVSKENGPYKWHDIKPKENNFS